MSTYIIVEDEPSLYDLLLAMFSMWGIDGQAFTDGESAVQWIDDVDAGRYRGEVPELALLDIRLPGRISGPMVGERLRKSPVLRDTVIVLTTAYRLSPQEERALRAQCNADDLIYKPLPNIAVLKKRLEKHTTQRRERLAAVQAQADAAEPADTTQQTAPSTPVTPTEPPGPVLEGPRRRPAGLKGPGAVPPAPPAPPPTLPEAPAEHADEDTATTSSSLSFLQSPVEDTTPAQPLPPARE